MTNPRNPAFGTPREKARLAHTWDRVSYGYGRGKAPSLVQWTTCPECGSGPGKLCVNSRGYPTWGCHFVRTSPGPMTEPKTVGHLRQEVLRRANEDLEESLARFDGLVAPVIEAGLVDDCPPTPPTVQKPVIRTKQDVAYLLSWVFFGFSVYDAERNDRLVALGFVTGMSRLTPKGQKLVDLMLAAAGFP